MDTPDEQFYQLKKEMFEEEGGFKIWLMWNPGATEEEYEYERGLWNHAKLKQELITAKNEEAYEMEQERLEILRQDL